MYDAIAIHFGEIWLKGKNRSMFVNRLYKNVLESVQGENYKRLENERDRFMLYLNKDSEISIIEKSLSKIFGVSWYAPVCICPNKLPDILEKAKEMIEESEIKSVKISASRSDKSLAYDSQDVVGTFFKAKSKLDFELDKNSENELHINVRKKDAVLRLGKRKGLGGLPVGSSGKAIVLLSGGIDSPVASFYGMKKGLQPIYLHLHGFPSIEDAESSKISSLASVLSLY